MRCRSLLMAGVLLLVAGCNSGNSAQVRQVPIQQNWELQPGVAVGEHRIAGGLGDISIEMSGDRVYAPFDGQLEANDVDGCYVFSSPEVPAYLFRLCGLRSPKLGRVKRGTHIGSADFLQFAALRRQPDGNWTMVEPANEVLQRVLSPQDIRVGGGEG
ncbi:hypothetical protein ACQ4M4_25945 [Leptolyngbya sp. AN02str]